MKLYDKDTGVVIADITTNHSMSIDDALDLMGYTVGDWDVDGGQIHDEDGKELNAWYDNLDMDWSC